LSALLNNSFKINPHGTASIGTTVWPSSRQTIQSLATSKLGTRLQDKGKASDEGEPLQISIPDLMG
jgi:hypothetical protein